MLANGAKETTTTTGTGTVTLSAVTGFPRFSQVLSVGQFVDYAIQDGNNWEWGVGKVAAGNTLERTRVTAKFDGGTYSRSPATKLSLSGGATVFCAINEAFGPVKSFVGGAIGQTYMHSAHLVQTDTYANTKALNGNTLYWLPFVWPGGAARIITSLSIYVTTAGAGTKARIVIFDPDSHGASPTMLYQSADIAIGTTGAKTETVSPALQIPHERFMLGLVTDGAVTLRASGGFLGDPEMGMRLTTGFGRPQIYSSVTSGWTEITNAMLSASGTSNEWDGRHVPLIIVGQL